MRRLLLGLMLSGCALPGSECGMFRQADVVEKDPGPGRCARILMEGDAVMARAPADGCSADEASSCLILMPGESGQGFTPAEVGHIADVTSGSRQEAKLVDGACPLACK